MLKIYSFRKFSIVCAIGVLLLFIPLTSFSTHIIGGDLSYRCTGAERYEVTLSVYTECGSTALLEQFYPIQYYATILGILSTNPLSFNVDKISTTEVPLLCNSAITDCNGGSLRGVEVVVYRGEVDLSEFNTVEDWRFFWQKSARSEEISTLVLPTEEDFFIEAALNNLDAPCNSSVTFQNAALGTACINEQYVFNNAAIDSDGDRLEYSLVAPKSSITNDVVFSSGFDADNFLPMTGSSSLNINTGDLAFTPNLLAIGIVDFIVEEYRDDKLVGWVRRGMQFTTLDCSNEPPELSLFAEPTTDEVSACAGESFELSLTAADVDGDPLIMTLLSGRSDLFTIQDNGSLSPIGLIEMADAEVGTYLFVVQVSDNICPQPGYDTKTYTVNIGDAPNFSFPFFITLSCGETTTLAPIVTGGSGNYTYVWNDGSTDPTLEVGSGTYSLTVTDDAGCSFTDRLFVFGEFLPAIDTQGLCFGQTTQFTDRTIDQSSNSDIVSWSWDFGDGSTSTIENPTHDYLAAGNYDVELTVTDNANPSCNYTIEKTIIICDPPTFDFTFDGTCQNDETIVHVAPVTAGSCYQPKEIMVDFGDQTVLSCISCTEFPHIYDHAGTFIVEVTVTNDQGCEQKMSRTIEIFPSPVVNIIPDDFYFICSNPNSLLTTEIVEGGTGAISMLWDTGETTDDITVDQPGKYLVTATDSKGCDLSDSVTITYPLNALFEYIPYCKPGDIVTFQDLSIDHSNTITNWEWDFGDVGSGTGNTATLQNPAHTFSKEGDFTIELKVTDSDGCEDVISGVIYNASIDDKFEVLPDMGVCLGGEMTGVGPNGEHIDEQVWSFDDGVSSLENSVSHTYQSVGEFDVSLVVTYNTNPMATSSCVTNFSEHFEVFELKDVDIVANTNRYCMNDELSFSFTGAENIQQAVWTFTNLSTGTSDILNGLSTTYTFEERDNFNIALEVTSDNGCAFRKSFNQYVDLIASPDFEGELNLCPGDQMTFTEAFRDTYENITDYRWDFGDNQSENGQYPMPLTTHAFATGGTFPVTLTVSNRFSGCENNVTKMVTVLSPPFVDFIFDDTCAENNVIFTNQTTAGDGEIISYQWILPDGSEVDTQDASFYFDQAGDFPVSLTVASSVGCSETLTKQVSVKENPKAGIAPLPDVVIQGFVPVQFFDQSLGEDLLYYWDFGDGTTSEEEDPVHTYQEGVQFLLEHAVTNAVGCSDTIRLLLDLNVYINLPNAFSPNIDGNNDKLRLLYQGIDRLLEFKVYNRYGRVVFDGKGDLNAAWDGMYNNQLQPMGVYVAHVEALGSDGHSYNFKTNVTLLR
jgi:gliding motility-associated-like protein